MLVKIPHAPDDLVDRVKAATGMATASKAFLAVANEHEKLLLKIEEQEAVIASLTSRLAYANSVIASARSSAAAMLGRVDPGQKHPASIKDLGDWFDSQASLDFPDRDQPADVGQVKGRDPGSS